MTRPPAAIRERAAQLFVEVYQLSAEDRKRYLDAACAGDEALRHAVDELLGHHDAPPARLRALEDLSKPVPRAVPETIGPYQILDILGRGGMGIVYRAVQHRPRRTVALKVLQPGLVRDDLLKRFEQEAEVLGRLQHPGIASVYDAGTCDVGFGAMPYFAMELVEGIPLTDFADRYRLDVRARCALIASVCDAVQHAHERGVVHRDLKPGNVLVARATTGDRRPQPKVLDFGIARTADTDLQVSTMSGLQTSTGLLLGTLPYMSPEQVSGMREAIDARADVYALGVMLYELLARRLPLDFEGRPLTEVGRIVHNEDPTLLGRIDRSLRGDLETICDKALAKEKERRYGSAAALAADLRRYQQSQPIAARPQTTWYQIRKFARRNKTLVGGTAATFLALVAGIVGIAIFAAGESAQKRVAQQARAEQRRTSYRSEMRLAGSLLEVPDGIVRIRETVAAWRPEPGEPDLRGWEWRFLDRFANRAERVFDRLEGTPQPACLAWTGPESGIMQMQRRIMRWSLDTPAVEVPRARKFHLRDVFADGRRLLCIDGGRVSVIDSVTGEETAAFVQRPGPQAGRWMPDGEHIVLFSRLAPEGYVMLRHLPSGRVVWRAKRPGEVDRNALACSPDGKWIAASHGLEGPAIYRASDGELVRKLNARADIFEVAWSPDSRLLAAGAVDRLIRIWDVAAGTEPTLLRGHAQTVHEIAFHPTRSLLASTSEDFTVRLWDLETGASRLLGSHDSRGGLVAWSPDGERLASVGDALRVFRITDAAPNRLVVPPSASGVRPRPLSWSPEGRLAAETPPNGARIYELDATIRSEPAPGGDPQWSRDGEWLMTRSGHRLEVRESVGDEPRWSHDFGEPARASWSPTADRLLVHTPERLLLWEPAAGEPHECVTQRFHWHAWHPGGKRVLLATWMDELHLFDAEHGQLTKVDLSLGSRPFAAAWSPDGTRFVLGTRDRTVVIARLDGSIVHRLEGHAGQVWAVAWSPDGSRVASGAWDRTVRIWDPVSGVELLKLAHSDNVVALAWSRDGERLASLCWDGSLRVFSAATECGGRR